LFKRVLICRFLWERNGIQCTSWLGLLKSCRQDVFRCFWSQQWLGKLLCLKRFS